MSTPTELEQRVSDLTEVYLGWIEAHGKQKTVDDRICEAVAADLVGVPAKRLRAWRAQGLGPAYVKLTGRVTYNLHDLAAWVIRSRQVTLESLEI